MMELAAWQSAIQAARRQGDHLAVYDLASEALAAFPDEDGFAYAAILALARLNAPTAARARYDQFVAAGRPGASADPTLAADVAALDGRLWKDQAWLQDGAERARCLARAAAAYERAYRRFGGYYPAINAASTYLAAGDTARARDFAQVALAAARGAQDYWAIVTRAEALVILGNFAAAGSTLGAIDPADLSSLDQVASTRRQLGWVGELAGAPPGIVDRLPSPRILHWLGAPGPVSVGGLGAVLRGDATVIGFVALLSADDLDVALALLDGGAAVQLVLPCAPAAWVEAVSLSDARRAVFDDLLRRAGEPLSVTSEGGVQEQAAQLMCRQETRGLAVLRANGLCTTAETLSVSEAGWCATPLPHGNADLAALVAPAEVAADQVRHARCIMFGDVKGFSRLSEREQLRFLERIIGGFASVLDRFPAVEYAETAGDGLYVVLSDIPSTVECGFALQAVLHPDAVRDAGLPAHLGLRLSAHVGPLYRRYDPVIRRDKFCGSEVIRTARIEPVTPVGEIFVTEQFAAVLACETRNSYVCEYAGRQKMAKGFGECRMYSLRRRF